MPVLGVDVGSSTSTVATISRGAIDIVLNDVSQRYSPTCVSYCELQRVFGDQANTQIVSNFKNTCRGFFNVLGLSLNEGEHNAVVTELDKFFSSTPLTADEKGHLSFQVTNGRDKYNVPAETALVGYLAYLTELAEKYTGGTCREVVLSYPSWFSEYQKCLLAAAVRASGSVCLRLISEGFAMAMDYGMYRVKQLTEASPTTVVLVNVGHSHTTVAVVDFYSSNCVILAEMSDRDLGGRYLEYLLMNEMCQEFNKKYNLDPLGNNKTRLKVEAMASKVKRVLSANSDSSYSLECLMDDYDLTGNVKRNDFEDLCSKDFLPRLAELLNSVMKMSGRSVESIHSVEVVGGITRVPCVQALVSQVFNKPVSKTLNSDESVARGCVLQGAMSSKHYMVRRYNVSERLAKPMSVCYLHGLGPFSPQQMQAAQTVVMGNVGASSSEIFAVNVGMEPPFTVMASFGDPRVNGCDQLPTFQYTLSSAASLNVDDEKPFKAEEQAEPQTEEMEGVDEYLKNVEKELKKEKGEKVGGLTDKGPEGWNVKFQFDETGTLYSFCRGLDVCMLPAFRVDWEHMKTQEEKSRHRDVNETNRLRTLNDLETFVYTVRDKLQTTHQEFVDPKNLSKFMGKLDETESWLYENRGATLEQFEKKYSGLKTQFEPVENNYKVYANKEQNLGNYFSRVKKLYEYVAGAGSGWEHVPQEERTKLANKLNGLNNSTMELVEAEKNMPKYNKPLYTMQQLEEELKKLSDEADQLLKAYKVVEQPAAETETEGDKQPDVHEPPETEGKEDEEMPEADKETEEVDMKDDTNN